MYGRDFRERAEAKKLKRWDCRDSKLWSRHANEAKRSPLPSSRRRGGGASPKEERAKSISTGEKAEWSLLSIQVSVTANPHSLTHMYARIVGITTQPGSVRYHSGRCHGWMAQLDGNYRGTGLILVHFDDAMYWCIYPWGTPVTLIFESNRTSVWWSMRGRSIAVKLSMGFFLRLVAEDRIPQVSSSPTGPLPLHTGPHSLAGR